MNNMINFILHSILLVWGLVGTGCAFTEMQLDLPLSQATTHYSGGEGRVIVIPGFVDNRAIKNRIGMKKNGYGQDTAPVLAKTELSSWLAARLGAELKAAEFQVMSDKSDSTSIEVNGTLLKYFIEPVIQWSTVDLEADVSVEIRVKRFDGLEAERKYYVKGINQGLVGSEGHFILAQKKAIDILMKRIVPDIINLLNKYPTTG